MQKLSLYILVALSVGIFSDCRSTKKIQSAMNKKDSLAVSAPTDTRADSIRFIHDVYAVVDSNLITFNTFSAKLKVNFEGNDGKKSDFNAFIRMYSDSVIWISVNALLGIEAFRVLVTRDSVKVLNKLDKVVQLRSVNYLQEVAKIPLSFKDLQNLLVGNPIYLDSNNIVSYKRDVNSVSLISIGDVFKHLLTVSKDEFLPLNSKLDDVNSKRARTAYITYGDYENKNGKKFSTARKITVSEKGRLDIQLQFKQFDFNVPLNFPFSIPKNYKSK